MLPVAVALRFIPALKPIQNVHALRLEQCVSHRKRRPLRIEFDHLYPLVIPDLIRDPEPRAMTFVALDPSVRWDDESCGQM